MLNRTTAQFASLGADGARLVEDLRQSLVLVRSGHGHGSGLIWESDGLIVTNHHVISHRDVEVETASGRRLPATVLARDPANDLAVLHVSATGLPPVRLGDSTALRVGELIVAVGHPLGLEGAAALGIVSRAPWGPGMSVAGVVSSGRPPRELLQVAIALAPGSSGGPLANASGEVVGLAAMVFGAGMAVAIPIHVVQRFMRRVDAEPLSW